MSGDNLPSGAGNQPLSSQQRTSLESLMTKVTSLTQQQRAELWAVSGTILVCREIHRCFRVTSAAEHNLAQRLLAAQKPFCPPAFSAIRGVFTSGE
ncbi:hypothetical protein DMI65_19955 [Escherichia coli]|nr:hypothetical protein [Escherichia coli]